jgi:hypothetical protein
MSSLTTKLLNAAVYSIKPDVNLAALLSHARKNKILLHLLRTYNIEGPLREQQELGIRKIVEVVQTLSKLLKEYNYAFFKLIKPVSYVPADVDLLIDESQAEKAAHEIMRLGYKVAVKDPYCISLTKGDSIIDLYVHPSLGGAIIIDGQRLLEHKCPMGFNGAEIMSLERYAEALVTASHAIYKERIYTLNDYFTIKEWADKKAFQLAEELKCEPSLRFAIKFNEAISKGLVETPYKIPLPTWANLLTWKILTDPQTRSTIKNLIMMLGSKRGLKLLASKFTRESY